MVEKLITLDNIRMVDFLGVQNENIKEVAMAFPKSKIVSRGNEILIKGSASEILQINDVLHSLVQHYHKHGSLTHQKVQSVVNRETEALKDVAGDETLVYGNRGFAIKPRTPNQKKLVEAIQENDLVFAVGPAGSGKTFVAVAMAVRALKNKEVQKIIITRPAVEAGENLGFLPGDLKEKIHPYLRPIYDALEEMISVEKLKVLQENNTIEIAPLAYMRGRTLNNAFVLLDEAQNTTSMQMKMFLTRMGNNSKMVVTGDQSQVDLPRNQKSGLAQAVNLLDNVKGIGTVFLNTKDVVRHRLVKSIINAYDKYSKENDKGQSSRE